MLQQVTLQDSLDCVYVRHNTSVLEIAGEGEEANHANVMLLPPLLPVRISYDSGHILPVPA